MAKIEYFTLNINYGGRFEFTDKGMRYVGGNFEGKWGLDADRFGYLDLVDEVEKLIEDRLWQLSGIPCMHAIAGILFMEHDPTNYVSDYFSVGRYLSGYEFGIEPIRGAKMWHKVAGFTVKPPPIKKMPGRPKKKRIRAPEEREGGRRLSKHGVLISCGNCLGRGHNRTTCKNPTVEKPHVEKRKRGKPTKQADPAQKQPTSMPSTSSSKKKNTYRERAIARSGVYINEPRRKIGKFKKPRTNSQASSSGVTGMATTQESRQEDGQ